MPLTRDQIVALRQRFEQQFGSGEAEWADTTPEGVRHWERTHARWNWFVDGYDGSALRVTCGGYGRTAMLNEIEIMGAVLKTSTGPAKEGVTAIRSTALQLPIELGNTGAANVVINGRFIPVTRPNSEFETRFEAVLT
jgi:hypothetical protein